MNKTLEAVRAKIIEAVPEIMEHVYCGSPCHCEQGRKKARSITLADVLRAIDEKYKFSSSTEHFRAKYELINPSYENGTYIRDARWNLALPLDEQEPEVIEFLHKILCHD